MKHFILAGIAMAFAASGAGAVSFTSTAGAPDPGVGPGASVLVDFDSPLPAGYALSGDYAITSGTTGSAAAPAGDASKYFYVSSAIPVGVATLSTPDLKKISFYWGSIDTYNKVDVLGAGGATLFTVTGGMLPPANGDQGAGITNRRIFFTADPGETITGLRFTSTGVAFELDTIGGTVPEPATWGLMIAGFGLVGLSARRRRIVVAA